MWGTGIIYLDYYPLHLIWGEELSSASRNTQNPTTSHHFLLYYSRPSCCPLLPGLLQCLLVSLFLPLAFHSLSSEQQPKLFCYNIRTSLSSISFTSFLPLSEQTPNSHMIYKELSNLSSFLPCPLHPYIHTDIPTICHLLPFASVLLASL